MFLPTKGPRSKLASDAVDLELLAPELLALRHPGHVVVPDASPKKHDIRVLRIDTNGRSTILELKRSELLRLTVEAAQLSDPHNEAANAEEMSGNTRAPMARRSKISLGSNYNTLQAVNMRDLRKLDPTFTSSCDPCVTVRKQAVLVNADPFRSIILRDACLVFLPEQAESFVPMLQEKLRELIAEKDESMAFEFRALEAILYALCKLLLMNCAKTFPQILSALERLAFIQISPAEMETLRQSKNTINEFHSQIESIRRVLTDLLDNETDLRMLYLTNLYEEPELLSHAILFDPEQAEVLVESYLQEIHTICTKIKLLQDRIHNTESHVMLKLDSARNHLLTVDVLFSLLTVSFTFGMFVTAAFGMNLHTGLEQSATAFLVVALGGFGVCVAIILIGLVYFRRKGMLTW
ncbi:hypothetical protein Poli38472_002166 [Pythium oligandrum]|uniref:Magnesium transporter n=1 Tax=Pythium oligandrum TaxID=41045 RepID=A0A8K1FGW3_PYTOL|nr:hypothetical protein Poli38472_002166 [Pythium oligandrum]|eukprot:TMW63225.1 hypothetical protein Poli38472_002166 [Pythium oligandrum]